MLVIVDYKMGNIGSITNILRRLGVESIVSSRREDIEAATALILPGVGAFDHGIRQLRDLGIAPVLQRKVVDEHTPILGICLGMQLMAGRSDEGKMPGLGWVDAEVKRFDPQQFDSPLKIPHMGWNYIEPNQPHLLFDGVDEPQRFYFVHSFHVCCRDASTVLAEAEYGYRFTAAVCRDNILGVQFHPEKSHRYGLSLLANYLRYCDHVSSESHPLPAFGTRKAG